MHAVRKWTPHSVCSLNSLKIESCGTTLSSYSQQSEFESRLRFAFIVLGSVFARPLADTLHDDCANMKFQFSIEKSWRAVGRAPHSFKDGILRRLISSSLYHPRPAIVCGGLAWDSRHTVRALTAPSSSLFFCTMYQIYSHIAYVPSSLSFNIYQVFGGCGRAADDMRDFQPPCASCSRRKILGAVHTKHNGCQQMEGCRAL